MAIAVDFGAAVLPGECRYNCVGYVTQANQPGILQGSCVYIGHRRAVTARHVLQDTNLPLSLFPPCSYQFHFATTNSEVVVSPCALLETRVATPLSAPPLDFVIAVLSEDIAGVEPVRLSWTIPPADAPLVIVGWWFGEELVCGQPANSGVLRKAGTTMLVPTMDAFGEVQIGGTCQSGTAACRSCDPGTGINLGGDSGGALFVERGCPAGCDDGQARIELVGLPVSVNTLTGTASAVLAWNLLANINGKQVLFCGRGDHNQDGSITTQDIYDYLDSFFASDACEAEVDGFPGISTGDLFQFLDAFFEGCDSPIPAVCDSCP